MATPLHIVPRVQPALVDDYFVVVVPGATRAVAFGDEVTVDVPRIGTIGPLHVAGVDTAPMQMLAKEVLLLFGFEETAAFVDFLSRTYGTAFTGETVVTLFTLHTTPFWEPAAGEKKGEDWTEDDPEDEIVDQGGVDGIR